ncbi:MAG: hypothetical protein ACYT04_59305 [Nostoc sp.]
MVQRNHLTKKSLRHLDQRWDSPQALTLGMPYPSCIAEAVRWGASAVGGFPDLRRLASGYADLKQLPCKSCLIETICFKILSRLAPMNLLPTARRKLEQCSRTA